MSTKDNLHFGNFIWVLVFEIVTLGIELWLKIFKLKYGFKWWWRKVITWNFDQFHAGSWLCWYKLFLRSANFFIHLIFLTSHNSQGFYFSFNFFFKIEVVAIIIIIILWSTNINYNRYYHYLKLLLYNKNKIEIIFNVK